jgi:hypothetical protein
MSLTPWGPPRPSRDADSGATFLRYWVFWVTLGLVAGAVPPVLALLVVGGTPVRAPVVILGGAVQGAVLGWTQATVLRVRVPALDRPRWVRATAIGAAAAWFLGLLPAEWADIWQRWPAGGQLTGAVLGGALLLLAPGIAQWTELRRHSRSAAWWVPGSAAAGCAGLVVFAAVVTPLWEPGQPVPLAVLVGVLAGVALAATTALAYGLILLRILRTTSHRQAI